MLLDSWDDFWRLWGLFILPDIRIVSPFTPVYKNSLRIAVLINYVILQFGNFDSYLRRPDQVILNFLDSPGFIANSTNIPGLLIQTSVAWLCCHVIAYCSNAIFC